MFCSSAKVCNLQIHSVMNPCFLRRKQQELRDDNETHTSASSIKHPARRMWLPPTTHTAVLMHNRNTLSAFCGTPWRWQELGTRLAFQTLFVACLWETWMLFKHKNSPQHFIVTHHQNLVWSRGRRGISNYHCTQTDLFWHLAFSFTNSGWKSGARQENRNNQL